MRHFILLISLLLPLWLGSSCAHKNHSEPQRRISSLPSDPLPSIGAMDFLKGMNLTKENRHVHFTHLDGFHAEIFKKLIFNQQLPHFAFLLSRAKVSFQASTVDKSETMKVMQSYLTSQVDTEVVGWWQFQKDDFRYYNTWIDPAGVIDYALGVRYPRFPTLFDFLAQKGERIISGFALHRRGIAFEDYSRNYKEGLQGAFQHAYFNQSHQTLKSLRDMFTKIAKTGGKLPRLTHSATAVADEWGHLLGITTDLVSPPTDLNQKDVEYCIDRKDDHTGKLREPLFQIVEKDLKDGARGAGVVFVDKGFKDGQIVPQKMAGHFYNIKKSLLGKLNHFCIRLPVLEIASDPLSPDQEKEKVSTYPKRRKVVHPEYVLAMLLVDIEMGNIINTLRSIRPPCQNGRSCFDPKEAKGIADYIKRKTPENSLFENTLFAFTADHGMTDSPAQMLACDDRVENGRKCDIGRSSLSYNSTFIEVLNGELGLTSPTPGGKTPPEALYGVDDVLLPVELTHPFKDSSWQNENVKNLVAQGQKWAGQFFGEFHALLKSELSSKFWWLFFLKEIFVFPKLDEGLGPYKQRAVDLMTDVYLRGVPEYGVEERKFFKEFYNRHVRLVYGGGARNNAEIFIPHQDENGYHWDQRPTYEEIFNYKTREDQETTVLANLLKNPGTGLAYIRKNNHLFQKGKPLPPIMEVTVLDKFGRKALLRVERDGPTRELVYGYKGLTAESPLGYDEISPGEWVFGTYSEWNHRSILHQHYYHNAVAGMGAFLYSDNDAIGDIVLMHSQGWCFGDNMGGHGGIHSDEKLIPLIFSGPEIEYGELLGRQSFITETEGEQYRLAPASESSGMTPLTYPTVLDIAPTILSYLGHGPDALTQFSQSPEFRTYLNKWVKGQIPEIIKNLDNVDNLQEVLKEAGLGNIKASTFKERMIRFFQFMPQEAPLPPREEESKTMGNILQLRRP